MGLPQRYMSPYQVKQWVADMRRLIGGEKEYYDVALYAGIKAELLVDMIMEGCDKDMSRRCEQALTRAKNDPSLTPDTDTPERAFNPHRYANVTRLLEMHRTTPVSQRVFGRAYTKEERAAFLRRQKRGI